MERNDIYKAYIRSKKLLVPALLGLILLVSVSFADKHHDRQQCTAVDVNITDRENYQFISDEDVLNILTKDKKEKLVGTPVSDLHIHRLEDRLMHNSFVKNAQVYTDMHGQLNVKLQQRIPLMRVINPAMQQYYIDVEGKRMPLSPAFAAYVPIATASYFQLNGERDSVLHVMDSSLFVLANYLAQDKFAQSVTGQIVIEPDNEFSIIPRLGDFRILLGDVSDLEDKFTRLKSFYRTTLPQVGWNKYRKISLKYKNQIVANT